MTDQYACTCTRSYDGKQIAVHHFDCPVHGDPGHRNSSPLEDAADPIAETALTQIVDEATTAAQSVAVTLRISETAALVGLLHRIDRHLSDLLREQGTDAVDAHVLRRLNEGATLHRAVAEVSEATGLTRGGARNIWSRGRLGRPIEKLRDQAGIPHKRFYGMPAHLKDQPQE